MSNSLPDAALSAALEAHTAARSQPSSQVLNGQDLTSLNKLLQWSTAHTDSAAQPNLPQKSPQQAEQDREWLNVAFPDTYADIKRLVTLLNERNLSVEDQVTALEGLEEVFADLNHAINIHKVGALDPILQSAQSPHPQVRAAAMWAIGTALQDLPEVKTVFVQRDGHLTIVQTLRDQSAPVRAKAVRAASALLRHSDDHQKSLFQQVGGMTALKAVLADQDVNTRRKARFFLQHANSTGNQQFVKDVVADRNAMAAFVGSLREIDVNDVHDVEAAVGAVNVLIEMDRMSVLRIAPELPGVIDALVKECTDGELRDSLVQLAKALG